MTMKITTIKRREHAARRQDEDRERLSVDVAAYLAAGNVITTLPSYIQASPARVVQVRGFS